MDKYIEFDIDSKKRAACVEQIGKGKVIVPGYLLVSST